MRVTVSLLPDAQHIDRDVDVAVVIDVLRATSVMTIALANGADRLITCRQISQASRIAETISPAPLLCGERGCRKIDGFDLGNSPAEYDRATVEGRSLVLTTTNGTAAIEAAAAANRVVVASFLNLSALIQSIADADNVHLICSGTEGRITAEDALLAGAILSGCQRQFSASTVGDESSLARALWDRAFGTDRVPDPAAVAQRLADTGGGRNLIKVGFNQDLVRCGAIDTAPVVPVRVQTAPMTFVASQM